MFDDQEDQTEELEVNEAEADEELAEVEVSEPELEEPEADEEVDSDESDEETQQDVEPEADEFSVSFDGDDDEEQEVKDEPNWARNLRKKQRTTAKENKKLKAELEELKGAKEKAKIADKPTLESCNWDETKFETELVAWQEQKRAVEKQKQAEAEAQQAEQDAWQKRIDGYNEAKKALASKAPDFEEAEEEVKDILSPVQQGALLHVSKQPDVLVYALGKNPKRAQKLAEIKDQALFIAELVRLETEMKVTNVKKAPKPERRVGGSGGVSKGAGNKLDKLREEAQKTGDYTKYFAAKNAAK